MECNTGSLSKYIIDFPKFKLNSEFLAQPTPVKREVKSEKHIVKSVSPKTVKSSRKIVIKEKPVPVNRSFIVKSKGIAKLTAEDHIRGDLM